MHYDCNHINSAHAVVSFGKNEGHSVNFETEGLYIKPLLGSTRYYLFYKHNCSNDVVTNDEVPSGKCTVAKIAHIANFEDFSLFYAVNKICNQDDPEYSACVQTLILFSGELPKDTDINDNALKYVPLTPIWSIFTPIAREYLEPIVENDNILVMPIELEMQHGEVIETRFKIDKNIKKACKLEK